MRLAWFWVGVWMMVLGCGDGSSADEPSADEEVKPCDDPRFTGQNCDECVDTRFTGESCDVCRTPAGDKDLDTVCPRWLQSTVNDLYMNESEVTVFQYRACVESGACAASEHDDSLWGPFACNYAWAGKENHPMNCVSFYGAENYCEWMGGRLPTDDEWEAEASNGAHGSIHGAIHPRRAASG